MPPPPTSPAARWAVLAATLPATADAYLQALNTLIEQAELPTADAGFADALSRFPNNLNLLRRWPRVAERAGDAPEALRRWQHAHAAYKANHVIVLGMACALIRTAALDAAEAVLDQALAPLRAAPSRAASDWVIRQLMLEHTRIAAMRNDWPTARQRWHTLQTLAPDDAEIRQVWHAISMRAARHDPDAHDAPPVVAESAEAALVTRFESLGASCEFGLVQRHFGAEPLSLMRWVAISPARLCAALHANLAGIGDPAFTRLTLRRDTEFVVTDTRFGLEMHSFVRNTGQDQAKLAAQFQRRLQFLRGKLLEDLARGEKFFIYRGRPSTTDADLAAIAQALRAYNPNNALLAVKHLASGTAPQLVTIASPRLLHTAIRPGRPPRSHDWNIDFPAWLAALRQAASLLTKPDEYRPTLSVRPVRF